MNGRAFSIGRLLARDQGVVEAVAGPAPSQPPVLSLDELVVRRRAFLAAYQDDAWADRYAARVRVLAAAERSIAPGSSTFALAVAEGLFKLMSTKDEYEVARLYTDGTFGAEVDRRFEGRYKVRYHLAPPLLARRDGATGEPRKIAFGPWMATAFRLLARLKRLRGTPFDPFGRTAERRADRRALADYERLLDEVTTRLSLATLPIAVELARLPLSVRGFGHVKAANAARARVLEQELQAALADPDRPRLAAE